MEFSRHANDLRRQLREIPRVRREVVVAPAARRQRFDFDVAFIRIEVVARLQGGAVVVDGRLRVVRPDEIRRPLQVPLIDVLGEFLLVCGTGRIKAQFLHVRRAFRACAGRLARDVIPDSRRIVALQNLLRDGQHVIQIIRIDAQAFPAPWPRRIRMAFRRAVLIHAVRTADAPFRMLPGGPFVPADRDVNLCVDAFFVADLDHAAHQIRLQIRMRNAKARIRIIDPPMMAAGEEIDGADAPQPQRGAEILFAEITADIQTMLRRVEIQMDLTIRQIRGEHVRLLFMCLSLNK